MARVVYLLIALALLGGAVFALLVAGAANWLACENQGTPACARQDLAFGQFILAMIGLVPALLLVVAVAVRKRWAATLALAVLLDAAVHGWDDLRLVP
jgi:hypothetical protein